MQPGASADCPGVRDVFFPQLLVQPHVGQEVCDPPAGRVGHIQLGDFVLKQMIVLMAEKDPYRFLLGVRCESTRRSKDFITTERLVCSH